MKPIQIQLRILLVLVLSFWSGCFSILSGAEDTNSKENTISCNFKNTDVRDVMDIFSKKLKKNIVVHADVKAQITASLEKVDTVEALSIICRTHKLCFIVDGGTIIVLSRELMASEGQSKGYETEIITIMKRSSKDIFASINVLSSGGEGGRAAEGAKASGASASSSLNWGSGVSYTGGKISYDERDNTVTINDTRANIDTLKEFITKLDRRTKGVIIEAKIVSIALKDEQKFGLDWSLLGQNREYKVPFGAASGGATTKLVSDPFPILGLNFTFSMLLDAVGQNNVVNLHTTPRTTVWSGEETKINVGDTVFYKATTYGPQNSTPIQDFKLLETGIKLIVTPFVYGNSVKLKIHPEVSKPTFNNPGDPPTINTSSAETTLMVDDGQTIVMGGLVQEDNSKLSSGIPFLNKIPIVGILFGSSEYHKNKTELVILINVKII